MRRNEQTNPPPGVLFTLSKGFDQTTRNIWLLLLPVILDLFFWLGPRLSFAALVEQMVNFWRSEAISTGIGEVNQEMLLELAPNTNLFTSLSVPIVGVPTHIMITVPERVPIPSFVIDLDNVWVCMLLLFLFSVVGLFLSALYLGLITKVVQSELVDEYEPVHWRSFLGRTMVSWLKVLGAVTLLFVVAALFYIPFIFMVALIFLVSGTMASVILSAAPIFAIWLLFFLVFVPHGLIMNRRPILRAVIESVRLVQRNLMATLGLMISVVVINFLLDWLLSAAEDGSWFTAVSIAGHAYVSTSLIVATFIFYHHRYRSMVTQST